MAEQIRLLFFVAPAQAAGEVSDIPDVPGGLAKQGNGVGVLLVVNNEVVTWLHQKIDR